MNDDFNDIFNSNTHAYDEPTEAVENEQPTTEEVTEEPVEAEPHVEVEAAEAGPELDEHVEDGKKSTGTVPLPTFLGMRDRSKTAEKTVEERDRTIAELQARLDEANKTPEVRAETPDPYYDPRGYIDHKANEILMQMTRQKVQTSYAIALQQFDPAEVEAAVSWGKPLESDPQFANKLASDNQPIVWLVQQHRAAQERSKFDALFADFQIDPYATAQRIMAEHGAAQDTVEATPPAVQTNATKVRPTSLRNVPATAAKITTQGANDDFNSIFLKK